MGKETTSPRPLGVILVHRQSGGPMVNESGRVVVFETATEAEGWMREHDSGDWYGVMGLVRNRPETSTPTPTPTPCNWITMMTDRTGRLCMQPYGHDSPHDATVAITRSN